LLADPRPSTMVNLCHHFLTPVQVQKRQKRCVFSTLSTHVFRVDSDTQQCIFLNSLPDMTFVNRERRFRALVLQNHPKSIRLFEHSENNLT
jgi:hypothetical protein